MTLEAVKKYPDHIYTLGPLIHNSQAVEFLRDIGIKVKHRIENIPKGTVIFRSHGVSFRDLKKAREKKLRIIDATCPIVKKAQFFAKFLHRQGYTLLIVGDAHHPEVEGIRSYLGKGIEVVENVRMVQRLGPWEKLGIIAQTTQSFNLFREVAAACLERTKEMRVFNTICNATTIRQKEAVEIAKKVDCMIVIGGFHSGNTQRLVEICREIQPCTYHIETIRELNPRWLKRSKKVGITAGASTPFWIIKGIEEKIRRLKG